MAHELKLSSWSRVWRRNRIAPGVGVSRTGSGGEVRLGGESKRARIEHSREGFHGGVVVLHRQIEIATFDADAVLRAFKLRPADRGSSRSPFRSGYFSATTSKRDKAEPSCPCARVETRRVARDRSARRWDRVSPDPTEARAAVISVRVDFSKLAAPETVGDEIGDEVSAPLIDVLHLRPRGVHALRELDEAVVTACPAMMTRIKTMPPRAARIAQPMPSFFITPRA